MELDLDECKHGLTTGTCSLCKPQPQRQKPERLGLVVLAKYDGYCPECGKPIVAGTDEIINDGCNWVHVECDD